MTFGFLYLIPNDILYYYIWPLVSNNVKMLLNKQLFNKYYKEYYNKYYNTYYNTYYNNNLQTKYFIYIIKNDIAISLSCILINNNIEQLIIKKNWYYNNQIFFNTYSFFIYLCKKYKSYSCEKILNNIFTQINIKEYKKYINKNIRWIK